MQIPDNYQQIIRDWHIIGKNGIFTLGVKYDNRKVLFTIVPDYLKFVFQVKKSMKDAGVEDQDIIKIISLIQNNYIEFYPDIHLLEENETQTNHSTKTEILDISDEQWQLELTSKLNTLKEVSDRNFPGIWPAIKFTLSIRNILKIDKISLPFAGIILGAPSSTKTLGLELLKGTPSTYYTDSFTPRAFVSHNTAVSEEKLLQIDLIPKIKNKLFMTPELGPMFSSKDEELIQNVGIFTRVLDGQGYESDTGAFGHRGYNEEIMFVWVGAAVEIPKKIYKYLATLGPKLYFYRIKIKKESEEELLKTLKQDNFSERKEELKKSLLDYISWFDRYPHSKSDVKTKLTKIEWDPSKDDETALRFIIKLGNLLAPLRGSAVAYETKNTQSSDYAYSIPTIEIPTRAITCLKHLAKGHALLEGRNYIGIEDIPIVIQTVMSTAPAERVMVFDLLLNMKGEAASLEIETYLNISRPTTLKTMTELRILGLVDVVKQSEAENAPQSIKLKKEYEWVLGKQFKILKEGTISEIRMEFGQHPVHNDKSQQSSTPIPDENEQ